MSNSSWKKWLRNTRERLGTQDKNARVALLGVGNEFNGDDAAGVLVARALQRKLTQAFRKEGREHRMKASSFLSGDALVIDAGLAPENFSGSLRSFDPSLILLVDAADMGESPGRIELVSWEAAGGFGASTHLQPLSTLGDYLTRELGCEVMLIGVQPAHSHFDHPVSNEVNQSVQALVKALFNLLFR